MKININSNLEALRGSVAKYNKNLQYYIKQKEEVQRNYTIDAYMDWNRKQLESLRESAKEAKQAMAEEEKAVHEEIDKTQVIKPSEVSGNLLALLNQDITVLSQEDIKENLQGATGAEERLLIGYAKKNGIELSELPASGEEKKKAFSRIVEFCRYIVSLDPDTPKSGAADRCKDLAERFESKFQNELAVINS